jgi:hypothetical protein
VIVSLNVPIDDRLADRIDDDRFDIRSGYARDRPGFGFSVLQDGVSNNTEGSQPDTTKQITASKA